MLDFPMNPETPEEDELNEELEGEEFEPEEGDDYEPDEPDETDDVAEDDESGDEDAPADDDLIPIQFVNEQGKRVEKKYKYNELSKIVYEAERRREMDANVDKFIQNTVPLVNEVNDSEILQHVLHYRAQGHSEDAIKQGLVKLWSEELEKKKKNYSSYDEEIRDKTMEELDHRLKPMEKKLVEMEEARMVAAARAHNNSVLEKVMANNGFSVKDVTETEYQEIAAKLLRMNPGKKIDQIMLDEVVADMLIKSTLGGKQRTPVNRAKQITKQAKAPSILPGKGGIKATSKTAKGREQDRPTTMEERIAKKHELFS